MVLFRYRGTAKTHSLHKIFSIIFVLQYSRSFFKHLKPEDYQGVSIVMYDFLTTIQTTQDGQRIYLKTKDKKKCTFIEHLFQFYRYLERDVMIKDIQCIHDSTIQASVIGS